MRPRIHQNKRPAISPRPTKAPNTPPTIGPTFDELELEPAEVVELVEVLVAEVEIWVDSGASIKH